MKSNKEKKTGKKKLKIRFLSPEASIYQFTLRQSYTEVSQ